MADKKKNYKDLDLTNRSTAKNKKATYGNFLDWLNIDMKGGYSSLWQGRQSRFTMFSKGESRNTKIKSALRRVSKSVDICLSAFGKKKDAKNFRFLVSNPDRGARYQDLPISSDLALQEGDVSQNWSESQINDVLYGQALSQVGSRLSTNQDTFNEASATKQSTQALYLATEHYKGQEKIAETLPGFLPYLKLFNGFLVDPKKEQNLTKLKQQLQDVHPEYLEDNRELFAYAIILNLYSEGEITKDLGQLNKDAIEDKTAEFLSKETTEERLQAIKDFLGDEGDEDNAPFSALGKKLDEIMQFLSKTREETSDSVSEEEGDFDKSVSEAREEAVRYPNESQVREVKSYLLQNQSSLIDEAREGRMEHIDAEELKEQYRRRKNRLSGQIQALRDKLTGLNQSLPMPVSDLTSGELDDGALDKIALGTDRLFAREEQFGKTQYNICLFIDESGSMHREHISNIVDLCTVVYEAIRNIDNVTCSIYGHSSDVHSERDCYVYRYATPYQDRPWLMELCHPRFQNYDSWAVLEMAFDLKDQLPTDSNTLIFVLSDGAPAGNAYGGEEAQNHTAECINHVRSLFKYQVLGLGICDAYPKEVGEKLFGKGSSLVIEGTQRALRIIPNHIHRVLSR